MENTQTPILSFWMQSKEEIYRQSLAAFYCMAASGQADKMCRECKPSEPEGYRRDWENLQVGDLAFDECTGSFGSGGFSYGIGNKVIEITDTEIVTEGHPSEGTRWDREKRHATNGPSAYRLVAFKSAKTPL